MTQEIDVLENDPMYTLGYNAGLEYAAKWITSILDGYPKEVVEFATNNAMSIRAAKREIQQEDFFDAVESDPTMSPELKAYWMSKKPG